jgi:DNA-binding transcriptional ArsR family regulator
MPSEEVQTIVSEEDIRALLAALDDADCRAILDATSGTALSVNEVSEGCAIPLSTAYRKLDLLADAGLIEERTRVRGSGKHPSEYSRIVEDVVVSFTPDGDMKVRVIQHGDRVT